MEDRVRVGGCAIGDVERVLIQQVLQDGVVGPGEMTAMFEREIAAAHGYKYAIALNSGQSALMVALKAESIRQGKRLKVALPAVTYISTFSAVIQADCDPVLVDVTSDTRANMVYKYVPEDVDAVIPVHLFGRAIDEKYPFPSEKYFVLEDACESAYAPGIGFGNALCLSFFSSHTITAGFGGAILTNDEELNFLMWKLVNHGRIKHDDYTATTNLADRFTFDEIGWSLKFSDLNAALGLGQHINREDNIKVRRFIAKTLKEQLAPHQWLETAPLDNNTCMLFPLVIDQSVDRPPSAGTRGMVIAALNAADIETRMMMPLTNQPVVKRIMGDDVESRFPQAAYLNQMGFYIGCHPNMTEEHVERIVETFNEIGGE